MTEQRIASTDMTKAPRDGTKLFVSGGSYKSPGGDDVSGPSIVAWDANANAWIMQDDHKGAYEGPAAWLAVAAS